MPREDDNRLPLSLSRLLGLSSLELGVRTRQAPCSDLPALAEEGLAALPASLTALHLLGNTVLEGHSLSHLVSLRTLELPVEKATDILALAVLTGLTALTVYAPLNLPLGPKHASALARLSQLQCLDTGLILGSQWPTLGAGMICLTHLCLRHYPRVASVELLGAGRALPGLRSLEIASFNSADMGVDVAEVKLFPGVTALRVLYGPLVIKSPCLLPELRLLEIEWGGRTAELTLEPTCLPRLQALSGLPGQLLSRPYSRRELPTPLGSVEALLMPSWMRLGPQIAYYPTTAAVRAAGQSARPLLFRPAHFDSTAAEERLWALQDRYPGLQRICVAVEAKLDPKLLGRSLRDGFPRLKRVWVVQVPPDSEEVGIQAFAEQLRAELAPSVAVSVHGKGFSSLLLRVTVI